LYDPLRDHSCDQDEESSTYKEHADALHRSLMDLSKASNTQISGGAPTGRPRPLHLVVRRLLPSGLFWAARAAGSWSERLRQ